MRARATALFDTLVPLDKLEDEQRKLVEESMAAFVRAQQDASWEAVATFHAEVMNAYKEYHEGLPEAFTKRLPPNAEALWLADKYWSMLKDWLNKQVVGDTTVSNHLVTLPHRGRGWGGETGCIFGLGYSNKHPP